MPLQPPDLKKLTPEQKDELILELWALVQVQREQIDALTKRVEAQEGEIADIKTKLGEPPKTSDNSSVPPSHVDPARGCSAETGGHPPSTTLVLETSNGLRQCIITFWQEL